MKNTIEADYIAAKIKTTTSTLEATGWKAGTIDPLHAGVDSVFFYVLDHSSKWMWSASVPRESFFQLLEASKALLESDIIAHCNVMIADSANQQIEGNPDKEKELAITLSAYIGITRSYQATAKATKANHFVVIRYGATDTLRPFALSGSATHLITAPAIQNAMQQVIELDTKNHPDWITA